MKGNPNQSFRRYMSGLDGLRALSVLAVIAYHLNLKWAQGGLLGVSIFFVLSGYLITDQLLREWKVNGRISIAGFWMRRLRRLLPAMLCMLLFVAVWLAISDISRLQNLRGEFLSSLFYVNNWYLIFHHISYFAEFGPPSPIGHLWSLAVEEQFYLIWPIAIYIGIRLAARRGKLLQWLLIGALLSALAMGVLYEPGTDPSRVYYGTDTRAFALLLGVALVVIWPSWRLNNKIKPAARAFLDGCGGFGLIVLLLLITGTDKYAEWLYRGGLFFISLLTAGVIAVLAHPASRLGKLMGGKPLAWIGRRSYSLYVWHYPIIALSSPVVAPEYKNVGLLLQVAVTFILSELSYKYVEGPIRQGQYSIQISVPWLKRRNGREVGNDMNKKKAEAVWGILITLIAVVGYLFIHTQANMAAGPPKEIPEKLIDIPRKQESTQPLSSADRKTTLNEVEAIRERANIPKQALSAKEEITVIGDSVIIGVEPYLKELFPNMIVDGEVGRQMHQAQDIINELREHGQLGERIVIELGTNGPFKDKQLRSLLQSLSDRKQILLVTTRVNKDWQDKVNSLLTSVAAEFTNTKVVDWYVASEGKPKYFAKDGVHLQPSGAKRYAELLAKALQQ